MLPHENNCYQTSNICVNLNLLQKKKGEKKLLISNYNVFSVMSPCALPSTSGMIKNSGKINEEWFDECESKY